MTVPRLIWKNMAMNGKTEADIEEHDHE